MRLWWPRRLRSGERIEHARGSAGKFGGSTREADVPPSGHSQGIVKRIGCRQREARAMKCSKPTCGPYGHIRRSVTQQFLYGQARRHVKQEHVEPRQGSDERRHAVDRALSEAGLAHGA
jgi:hypothetical protein